MKLKLVEKLYCLNFTPEEDPVEKIKEMTEILAEGMGFSKVIVYLWTEEGRRLLASTPDESVEIDSDEKFFINEIKSDYGEKVGELWALQKKRSFITSRKQRIIAAFIYQLKGLLTKIACKEITSTDNLYEEVKRYKSLLCRDKLTGLYNRHYFEETITQLEKEEVYPVSVIIVDIDGLKIINDNLGHSQGDRLLKEAAILMRKGFRASDKVSRIGGDEFAVLLPGAPEKVAKRRCETLLNTLVSYNKKDQFPPVLFSVGTATAEHGKKSLKTAIEEADLNMYKEKQKNRLKHSHFLHKAISAKANKQSRERLAFDL